MSVKLASTTFWKGAVKIGLIEAILLGTSFYGFWQWISIAKQNNEIINERLFWLLGCSIAPLTLFVIIAVRGVTGMGRTLSALEFQSRIDVLQKRLNAQDDFFRSIATTISVPLTIFTHDNDYWFANIGAAKSLGVAAAELIGKKPVAILGAERGRKIEKALLQARQSPKPLSLLMPVTDDKNGAHYIQATYQTLPTCGDFPGGIMAREENVTDLVIEREKRENMLRQVISTLVGVVDRRDPYASGHSFRVGQLARAIAAEMQLSDREIEAAEIAGSLMNFGKVLVSREILTKTDNLSQGELQRIRDGILTQIEFNAPVVPTLRQILERYDGTGEPAGLKGDGILIEARIVAVANAYVALVSPRAYRPGTDFVAAAERLAKEAGKAFDPTVIAALESLLRKNSGKLEWLSVGKPA